MGEIFKQDILLESGTNEMEIIEFYLGKQSFGINVHKLREIIPYDPTATIILPDAPASMLGALLLRDRTIPLIDLKSHVEIRSATEPGTRKVVMVCEFNGQTNGFLVDGVDQIHRVSWEQIQPMAGFFNQYQPRFTGSINIDKREILVVDLEHVVAEITPGSGMAYDETQDDAATAGPENRRTKKLLLVEDSAIIRAGIQKILERSGYIQLEIFDNGLDCYNRIQAIHRLSQSSEAAFDDLLHLVITDIEMPKMDGLTLCRRIKEGPNPSQVKVLVFSSLINEQMSLKCRQVGADGLCSKGQASDLVVMIDRLLFAA